MADPKETPSQTAGPYVHIGCLPSVAGLAEAYGGVDPGRIMVTGEPKGARIALTLTILDGAGEPLKDAMVEIWQAGPDGTFGPTDGFTHWGRQAADPETGAIRFDTLKPGRTGTQAPHIFVWIVARGINIALTTRIYFPDEENGGDPVLDLAGDRAKTLIARSVEDGYDHVIRLQGERETVFFDV